MSENKHKEELEKVKEIARLIKKRLKPHSKSKLIEIIIAYASDLQEMQKLARLLHEDNQELKAKLDIKK